VGSAHLPSTSAVWSEEFPVPLDEAMAENLRWTLVTMAVLLTAFAGLILRFG
jgi:hypothetical protein